MEIAISIKDLTVSYEDKKILSNINMEIPKGKLIGIIGPNGGGKSTFIKGILNIVKKNSGIVKFQGEDYRKYLKKIAYIPQRDTVDWDFPTTVLDVVIMGSYGRLGLFKSPGKKEKEKAIKNLKKLNIEKYFDRQISQLSGGEKQRVFIARALMQEAEIYFMDEPFQGVDIKTEKEIIEILKKLKEMGKTVLVVHHNLEKVKDYFDYLIMINRKIVAIGETEDIFIEENINKTFYRNY
ncbi:metal ABC transporter ATP-binding protein [Fusobacterium sp. IOR10]|uniref:metal ABC transporter ATP-binding protein n=1 Tax=Fusobacterium sp. IOR10 TaxID=2665157 RepID=UPI0013D22B79|nr:metal ABC transporter ATP-binding protein [Fusobacterium sp. IOR10]